MFCLRVTYLTGRVYAVPFEEGDDKRSVEWPPHPGRLFQALVAAWGETGKDDAEERFLTWLEGRKPPAIVFDVGGDYRATVTTYVPINDSNEQFHRIKGTFFQTISETVQLRRDRKARRFPSLTPVAPVVHFLWEEALPAEHRPAVEKLLRSVTYLGHSSTLVNVEPASPPPDPQTVLRPDPEGSRRLRVPAVGRLERLEAQFARFQQNPVKTNRPDAGPSALYAPPRGGSERSARTAFSEMLILRRIRGDRLSLRSTLLLTAAFRGAIMKFFGENSAPEFVSGHAPGSTRDKPIPSEQPHLAFVPIADVGHDYARGHLMGIAALVPRTLSRDDAELCARAVASVEELRMGRAGVWQVEPAPVIDAPWALRQETWCRRASRWATVTPFVFDRFPDDLYGEDAEKIVRTACARVISAPDGQPCRPTHVMLLPVSAHIGVPASRAFPPALARPGKPRRCQLHVILDFEQNVHGPFAIGAGRYYGYGLCRAIN